jgi:hypothetical protein
MESNAEHCSSGLQWESAGDQPSAGAVDDAAGAIITLCELAPIMAQLERAQIGVVPQHISAGPLLTTMEPKHVPRLESASRASNPKSAVTDALRRMERTMVNKKCHLAAEEARRWGRHLPKIANHAEAAEEIEQIVDSLATFRRLHSARADLRRRIGQATVPAPTRKKASGHLHQLSVDKIAKRADSARPVTTLVTITPTPMLIAPSRPELA